MVGWQLFLDKDTDSVLEEWQLLCGFWRVFPLVDVLDTELSACYQSHFSEAVPAMWSVLICLL